MIADDTQNNSQNYSQKHILWIGRDVNHEYLEMLRAKFSVVDIATNHDSALRCSESKFYDSLIIDIHETISDELKILCQLRAAGFHSPAIVLGNQADRDAIVRVLDAGADAFHIKPFAFEDLVAVMRAHWRRANSTKGDSLEFGDLSINFVHQTVIRGQQRMDLTPKEFSLLSLLARHRGSVLSRNQIGRAVWGVDLDTTTNVVDVHIRRLRSKVDDPFPKKLIHTVRGKGYIIRKPEPKVYE